MLSKISRKQKIFVMIAVMLTMLLSALDQTIVATAMPRIVQELNGLQYLSWITTIYLLTSTITIPIAGKVSDIVGRKKIYIAGIFIFLLGSMLSGLSQNIGELILFRGIQGFGAGILETISFTIIGDLFVPAERGKWQGLFGAVFGLASLVGPILGGWLTDHASWRWNFYINIPVGIIALIAIFTLLPNIITEVKNKTIDYAGIAALSAGLGTLLLGLVWGGSQYPWISWQSAVLALVTAGAFTAFGFIESKAVNAILPLDLFKNSVFTVTSIITFFLSLGMFGAILYIPLFAQNVIGVNATNSGTILTPLVFALIITSIIAGQAVSRTGRYKVLGIIGMGILTLALFWLSTVNASTTQFELVVRMIATGIGIGFAFPIFSLAVQNAFDHSRLAVATSSNQLFRNLGSTVGTAVMGTILTSTLTGKLQAISNNNTVKTIKAINPAFSLQGASVNNIQILLSKTFTTKIIASASQLPSPIHATFVDSFTALIYSIKDAMASSIAHVYLIGACLMVIAFVMTFFLKETPLKTHHEQTENMPEILGEEIIDAPLNIE